MIKRILGYAGIVLASVLVLVLGYGTFIEPRIILDERHYEAEIPHLDEEWEGQEVAVISDLQVGMMFANLGMVERIVDTIVEEEPAAVLIAGDFLYSETPEPEVQVAIVLDLLEPILAASIPTYAVLGNHDYMSGGDEPLTAALRNAGVTVLSNESAEMKLDGASEIQKPLHLVGIAPAHDDLADVDAALHNIAPDEPRLVMMHHPKTFLDLPADAAPLAVAGHTHCGQIAAPFTPHLSWLALTTDEPMVADGFAEDGHGAEGNTLYVNCGIGFSEFAVRINAPPQVTFFELVQ